MSTSGVIAKPCGDGWTGTYHHWDAYPRELGKTLWTAYHGVFKRDHLAMIKTLIDDEPAGWSTINGCDLSKPPAWNGVDIDKLGGWSAVGPQSYTQRGDGPWEDAIECQCPKEDKGCLGACIQWAYVLNRDGISIYDVDRNAPGSPHRLLTVVRWDGEEPDWAAIEATHRLREDCIV